MAFAGLVDAGEDRVDDAQRRVAPDAPVRDAVPGAHAPSASAAASSARTTVVPTAMMRPPFAFVSRDRRRGRCGMR